jgi:hypothetical protein
MECTSFFSRRCPICGDCICKPGSIFAQPLDPDCPLHSVKSDHDMQAVTIWGIVPIGVGLGSKEPCLAN